MSNKTIKQRIAVVAASALTAGFLSVIAMPAANAAAGDFTVTASTGVVTAPSVTAASAGTATITTTGSITFAAAAVSSVAVEFRISGGTFTSVTSGANINADGTKAYQTAITDAGTAIAGLVAKPTGAGRNMVVQTFTSTNGSASSAAAVTAAAAATVAKQTMTATVIAAGTNGVFSSGLSAIAIVNSASTSSSATNADTDKANIVRAGATGVISYSLYDANANALSSSSIVYASIKSGACVIGLSTAPTSGTMVVGDSPADLIYVAQADSTNTPATTCVVEITVDGVLAATKSFTFQGTVASITVTGLTIGAAGANTAMGYLVATDSAGNNIGNVSVSGVALDSSKSLIVNTPTVAAVTTYNNVNLLPSSPATTPVTVGWTCGSVVGTAPIAFRTSNGVGGYITSPTYNVQCGGNPVTYTAALDKASYVPGEIATLTVTGKGSKGETPNDAFAIESATAADQITLAGSQLTLVGTLGTTGKLTSGVRTYKFVVGSTEGSYNMVVEVPLIATSNNKTLYGAATQTVAYKVSAGTTAVSNADVLKSIVALIASINKQIQALQKLILARR